MEDMSTKNLKKKMKRYEDMKRYKILYNRVSTKNGIVFLLGIVISFLSCSRDIDSKIKDCYYANDTIINLCDLYPEEWDTVYFCGACSSEDIAERVGPVIYRLWEDVGDKILLLNKNKEVVYYKERDMYYGQDLKGAVFQFNNDSLIIAIARENATFLIRKRDENSFWLIHQKRE